MSLLDTVKGISNEKPNKFSIFMGSPGSGKTTIAGTYPKPMLYVAIGDDGGGIVLQKYSDDEVKVINLKTDSSGTSVKKMKELLCELRDKPNHGFKTVVIDAWTSLQEDIEKFVKDKKGANLNFDEWASIGKELLDCRDLAVDVSKNQDCEIVAICHTKDKEESDSVTGETFKKIVLKMTGNNGKILLERANNVVYCCRKNVKNSDGTTEVKFLAYIGAHPNMDTKLRTAKKIFDGVGTYLENCTFEKIEELKNGKVAEKIEVVESTSANPFDTDEGDGNQW